MGVGFGIEPGMLGQKAIGLPLYHSWHRGSEKFTIKLYNIENESRTNNFFKFSNAEISIPGKSDARQRKLGKVSFSITHLGMSRGYHKNGVGTPALAAAP